MTPTDQVAKRLYDIMNARDEYAPPWDLASHDQKVPAFALARAAIETYEKAKATTTPPAVME